MDLSRADLSNADLFGAALDSSHADLSGGNLGGANLTEASLEHTRFDHARVRPTRFVNVDLSIGNGLDTVKHGHSTIGIDTIYRSGGKIPEAFLRDLPA